ncbi:MAG: hypothetical protein CME38_01480 [Haliea sp.]|nr:hypothetical protein [Haliea sp.]|tara:strand:+ start:1678 stop:2061 length:384 start_codon:yes stop_codon:yes gene_type:complete
MTDDQKAPVQPTSAVPEGWTVHRAGPYRFIVTAPNGTTRNVWEDAAAPVERLLFAMLSAAAQPQATCDAEDAARYRWLKANDFEMGCIDQCSDGYFTWDGDDPIPAHGYHATADEAIDAARTGAGDE